jgi:hypothetical protein
MACETSIQTSSGRKSALHIRDSEKVFGCVVEQLQTEFSSLVSEKKLADFYHSRSNSLKLSQDPLPGNIVARFLPNNAIEINRSVFHRLLTAVGNNKSIDEEAMRKVSQLMLPTIAHELDHARDLAELSKKLGVPFSSSTAEGEALAHVQEARVAAKITSRTGDKGLPQLSFRDFEIISPQYPQVLNLVGQILKSGLGASALVDSFRHKSGPIFSPSVLKDSATSIAVSLTELLNRLPPESIEREAINRALVVYRDPAKFAILQTHYRERLARGY